MSIIKSAGCSLYTMADLAAYRKLSHKDIERMCKESGMSKLKEVEDRIQQRFQPALETLKGSDPLDTKNCIDFTDLLKEKINIAKDCVKGTVELTSDDTSTILKENIKRICTMLRMGAYEQQTLNCIDPDEVSACEGQVLKKPGYFMENGDEFASIGLTYGEKGRSTWIEMQDCTSDYVQDKSKCSPTEKKKHKELTEQFKATLKKRG